MRSILVVAAAAALAVSTARAEPVCQGRLSGKVTGTFACDVTLTEPGDGEAMFVVQPRGPIPTSRPTRPGPFASRSPSGPGP